MTIGCTLVVIAGMITIISCTMETHSNGIQSAPYYMHVYMLIVNVCMFIC